MTKRKWLERQVEKVDKGGIKVKLASLALLWTLLFGKVANWSAQELKTQERKDELKEITVQIPDEIDSDTTITLEDGKKFPGIEPDPLEWETTQWDEWQETWTDEWKEKEEKLEVHGTIRWGSDVTPLLWSVLSDRPALMLTVDA